jgi:fatty acid desaturase
MSGARSRPEWPTILLAVLIHSAWVSLIWFHAAIPWWMFVAAASIVSAWYGSLQHEIIHGHPTRSAAFNAALAAPPLWLWLPFERYRDTHLQHHRDARLTDPIDDPESRYWTQEAWARLGPIGRAWVLAQTTLAGRLLFGPSWAIGRFLWTEARMADRRTRRIWLRHSMLLAPFLYWTFWICAVPPWLYVLGVIQGGGALTLIRSHAEHRAAIEPARRTAIVENSFLLGPIFLFNNLHAAHHRWPSLPWYRLPERYRRERAALLAENGGLVYRGYGEVFRRFLLTPHDQPLHPQGRAP